ncbi:STAS/SEC14 domain-containing protein [Pontibacter sp. KCTC 32443]|uniref:STAS/SEC14 domain-containing protein n=1 Tax=Pontibacter TaxID=323449 RepID=UPI00164DAF5A|nr:MULTISPECIES: STAS/SEC14 domain-containing protein [Pontibacter]MBC5774943.1 STAS/SEC14 domain-containing protein [Pontibacter sp. KCTC 32443]
MILQHALISETVTTDQSLYSIRYSEPLSLVEITWNGLVTSQGLQAALTHLIEVIEDKQPRYLLADTRRLNSLGTEDHNWVKHSFLPALSTSSIVKFARITEPDVFTHAIIDSLLSYVQGEEYFGCIMRSFNDREAALDWLYATI